MPDVREVLAWGRGQLRAAGVDSPGLDAEVLLAQALGVPRSSLLASLQESLPPDVISRYEEGIGRRAAREPLAYITGIREFWGRPFEVDPRVLIPRPETELLVERALDAGAGPGGAVTDVGTGSGCLAVTLALELPEARVYATDVSESALELAARNARSLDAGSRVNFLAGNGLGPLPEPVGLVVANLPYVPTGELDQLQPEVRLWEPRSALDGGPDGLGPIRELLSDLPRHTLPGATCLLELDPRQYDSLREEIEMRQPHWAVRAHRDLAGRVRVAEIDLFTAS